MEDNKQTQDQQLFDSIGKAKKKKKKRLITTIIIVVVAVVALLAVGTTILKKKVKTQFAASSAEVKSAEATVGSISTTVSGKGSLTVVDSEKLTIPSNVEVEEVKVTANTAVEKGDIIATLDSTSIASAIETIQSEIDTLDDEIADASSDKLDSSVKAGVAGRVVKIYAKADDSVSKCMAENGALVLLSVDGYMAIDMESDSLKKGDEVTVVTSDGETVQGDVDSVANNTAVILVSDTDVSLDEEVTVKDSDGKELGKGTAYVHNAIKVTGIGGTVSAVKVSVGDKVSASTTVVTLTDTSYAGTYNSLIKQRNEKEEKLVELLKLQENNALVATFTGTISTVSYDESSTSSSSYSTEVTDVDIATLAPNDYMQVTIDVDETDILSLENGQTATISINSLGDETYEGTVTEINKEATTSSGVTKYQATIQLEKAEKMLSGMTASVAIKIEGVDDAILIPVDALHQTSSSSFVYTTYDEENEEYGGEVQVEVGLSNSNYVEIKSGLAEGDTVYYTESSSNSFMGGDFDMSNMPNGGDFDMSNMPNGGNFDPSNMPSGGGGNMPSGMNFGGDK